MTAPGNGQEYNHRHSKIDGAWIRKAAFFENFYQEAHDQGKFHLCYKLRIKSKSPLKEEQVRLALTHLYRKCPNLQFCFGFRNGRRWLKRATNNVVDFKVLKGQVVQDVMKSLYSFRYNCEKGPLFCARLLLDTIDPSETEDNLDISFSHNASMLFGLHHAVGDGTTNTYIMGCFISLLNDVIKSKPVCDDEPLGEHIGDEYTEAIVEETRKQLRADPPLAVKVSQETESFENHSAYLAYSFPKSGETEATNSLEYTLDTDTTEKFLQKCRQQKITFNSGFSAVVSVALTDLLSKERLVTKQSFKIQFYTMVNARRYWRIKFPAALGTHIGAALPTTTEVPANLGDDYWEYATFLHDSIRHDINAKNPILCQALETLKSNEMSVSNMVENNGKMCVEFCLTNLGDITPAVFNAESQARITHISRTVEIGNANKANLVIFCHTFRGKFIMTFAHQTSIIGTKVIERLCEQIITRMKSIHNSC